MIELTKNQKIIVIAILIIVVLVIGYYIWDTSKSNESEFISQSEEIINENSEIEEALNNSSKEIVIHVAGAVENEGIQKLPEESRVADAIEAAGGLTSDANLKNINLAQKILDGQKIYIPNNTEQEENMSQEATIIEDSTSNIAFSENNGLININTATQTELETLPGIGPSTALNIINYRNENGNFKTIEDIQNVSGIGDNKFEQIRDRIII